MRVQHRYRGRAGAVVAGVAAAVLLGAAVPAGAHGSGHEGRQGGGNHGRKYISLQEATRIGEHRIGGTAVSVELEELEAEGGEKASKKDGKKDGKKAGRSGKKAGNKHGKKDGKNGSRSGKKARYVWEVEVRRPHETKIWEVQIDPRTGCIVSGPRLEN